MSSSGSEGNPPGATQDIKDPAKKTGSQTSLTRKVSSKARPKTEEPDFMVYFLLATIIVLGSYLVGIYNPTNLRFVEPTKSRTTCDNGSWSLQFLNTKEVRKYRWEPTIPFTAQLASWREPVILTNTFVNDWKAIKLWTSDHYLASKPELAVLNGTMIVDECQMSPSLQHNALSKSGLISYAGNFQSRNVTASEFFSKFNEPTESKYWYWYGKVEASLRDDVLPNDGLWIDAQDQEQFGLYMWLSGPDIGPWWHYDQDHNFYVQVTGTKRFILVPPWETPKMYPFPQIHPRNHKSQVDFDHPDLKRFPDYSTIKDAFIAELKPGEVMYIPPYWWHHVRSHTRSLSLASWSQSGVFRVMRYGLYKRTFAADLQKSSQEKFTSFAYTLKRIASTMYGEDNNYFSELIRTRWEPIRKELEASISKIPGQAELNQKKNLCPDLPDFIVPGNELYDKIELDVKASIEAFQNAQTKVGSTDGIGIDRRDMKAIRDVEFADFTEFMLSDIVGPERVLAFLDQCLAT